MLTLNETDKGWQATPQDMAKIDGDLGDIYAAAVTGLRDYVEKTVSRRAAWPFGRH